MAMNRTLGARGATGAGVEKPCGSTQRRVKQGDGNETERCQKRAPALLIQKSHFYVSLVKSYAKSALIDQTRMTRPGKLHRYSPMGKNCRLEAPNLDLAFAASQTRSMAHAYGIYIRFDFGKDEERAQQARHKLEGWRQAFRLDKRVQYKMDRPGIAVSETAARTAPAEKPVTAAKGKEKSAAKGAKAVGKSSEPAASKAAAAKSDGDADGKVGLLVRLYFSPHEKLSEQRWLSRIPAEEPFKSASPKIISHDDPEFEATDQQFESIPVGEAGGRSS